MNKNKLMEKIRKDCLLLDNKKKCEKAFKRFSKNIDYAMKIDFGDEINKFVRTLHEQKDITAKVETEIAMNKKLIKKQKRDIERMRFVITNEKEILEVKNDPLCFFDYIFLCLQILAGDFKSYLDFLTTGDGEPSSISLVYIKGIGKAEKYMNMSDEEFGRELSDYYAYEDFIHSID